MLPTVYDSLHFFVKFTLFLATVRGDASSTRNEITNGKPYSGSITSDAKSNDENGDTDD